MVAGSILAKASSVGANTVSPGLLFRVSTRFTFGLSLPDSADVNVVSTGLFDAATATGSWAMPATEPGPLGTVLAYPAQPEPTRSAPESAIALGGAADVIAWLDGVLAEGLAFSVDFSLEQAERPSTATALRPATAIAVQCVVF